MESENNPIKETKQIYINQSRLSERLTTINRFNERTTKMDSLIIWDVGLGLAMNAMETIKCHREVVNPKLMELISFETDLEPLKSALNNSEKFPHLYEDAPIKLLENGNWTSESGLINWKLVLGDFRKTFAHEKIPDLIFIDPTFYQKEVSLLSVKFLEELYSYISQSEKIVRLYTYSSSTAICSAFLYSGFWVGKGIGTGDQTETTIAYTSIPDTELEQKNLLSKEWLFHRDMSNDRYPHDLEKEKKMNWESKIVNHVQFS